MGNEAAERTEDATPRRRQKEREKGNVSKSRDMDAALVMVAGVSLLAVFAKFMGETILNMMRETFSQLHTFVNADASNIQGLTFPYFRFLGFIVLPFFVLLVIFSILIIRMDVGPVFAIQKIKINPENLSPRKMIQNVKRLLNPFAPRSLVELAKSIMKIVVVASCGISAINARKNDLLGLVGLDPETSLHIILAILVNMIISMCLAMLILGFIDKKYQQYEYEKSIKILLRAIIVALPAGLIIWLLSQVLL